MNYTGRPSISGCRPVLSLYPTHRFCQYLLLIFITFTNSFLFNRAFSTNSRRPLSHAAGVTAPPEGEELNLSVIASQCHCPGSTSPSLLRNATARVAAPSVCFAAARILLAAAPTAPPCFRHWRRSSPLLLPRGGFGSPRKVNGFARGSPTRGAVEELATRLRGCTKESLTVSHCWAQPLRHCFAMPPPLPRGGFGIAENFSSSPEAPLLGELSAKQTERLYEDGAFPL